MKSICEAGQGTCWLYALILSDFEVPDAYRNRFLRVRGIRMAAAHTPALYSRARTPCSAKR